MLYRFAIAVGAVVLALGIAGGAGADIIPDSVSQHDHFTRAAAIWRFEEPHGWTQVFVEMSDHFDVAAHGLQLREKQVCVNIDRLDESNPALRFQAVHGCRPLEKGEYNIGPRFDGAFFKGTVSLECQPTIPCATLPRSVDVDLTWSGGGELFTGHSNGVDALCHTFGWSLYRQDMEVRGAITDASTGIDYTRGEAGRGDMGRSLRSFIVLDGPFDC